MGPEVAYFAKESFSGIGWGFMQQKFWQRIRIIRWFLFLAMVGTVLVLFVGLKLQSKERLVPAVVAKAVGGDGSLRLNNFEYRDVKEGNARWTVWATTARYFEDKQQTFLDQVRAVFFLKDGGQVELQGDVGTLYNESEKMEISGNVRVRYGEDYRLLTDSLVYERDKELIHTAAPVFVKGKGFILKGQGMRLEIGRRTLSIMSGIETTLEGILSFEGERQKVS
jgi:LPS export ABC transporter protein LptC